ncbi:hypothetical protein K443DRAFT_105568, partial [Laccaria amethystina LaAM-08-1]
DLHSSLKFKPPLHRQRACTSQSRLFPHQLSSVNPWPISVSSRLMSIVGRALQTTRGNGFVSVCVALRRIKLV